MLYLRVENKVSYIPDIDFLCTVGESTSRGKNELIGQFGSGFVYTLSLFARKGILENCKVCLGKDVYVPYIDSASKKDSAGNIRQINKIGLKKQNGGSYDLNISTGFGEVDWTDITMGVREIISNAFDGAETYDGTYSSVVIETVGANQCRAADGVIRVYIPITNEISDYVANIEHFFLCYKRTYNPNIRVIPKQGIGPCRIYRKGVLVGEFGKNSLFDYNLPNIPLNESRIVNSNEAKECIGRTILTSGRDDQTDKFVREVMINDSDEYWESQISVWGLQPYYFHGDNKKIGTEKLTSSANRLLNTSVLCENEIERVMVNAKGFNGVCARNTDFYNLLESCSGIKTAKTILDDIEALGNTIIDPTPVVIAVLDKIWNKLSELNLTNGRDKPPVSCFNSAVNGSTKTFGYCSPDYTKIYIHQDISHDTGNQLYNVMLEEVGHYVTKATDYTRDFQSFFVGLSARLMNQ